MYTENELYHHGVKGMKWGVRKERKTLGKSDLRKRYDEAKTGKKAASRQYSRDFDNAYNYSSRYGISQYLNKGRKAESDYRWRKAYDSADASRKADAKYKSVKNERKTAIKNKAKELNDSASVKEKLVYNKATRKLAAKYVVDHNMTVSEATKKAKGEAWRNTAILLAANGVYLAAAKKKGYI